MKKKKNTVKEDCFAFRRLGKHFDCIALDDVYCSFEECKFYKTNIQYKKENNIWEY